MPQFDFAPKAVQQVNVVGQRDDNTALQIKQQGMEFVEQGVKNVVGVVRDKFKEMDEADMVSARSAMLRIQSDEDKELLSTSNPADIKKIQEKYNKRYQKIIDGNEPLNGKPYFRNQSGKNAFKKGFVNQFNGSRYLQGEKQEFELQRRDTQVKYTNGIKSIIDQPEWNTPMAHKELDEIASKFFQDGFQTAEENVAYKKEQHQILDTERANKMFADLEALPVETPKNQEDLKNVQEFYSVENDKYKEYIDSLDYLDQDQKNDYKKNSDKLYADRSKASSLQMKEMNDAFKKTEAQYNLELRRKWYNREIKASDITKDPRADKGSLDLVGATARKEIDEDNNRKVNKKFNVVTKNRVMGYDIADDPDGSIMHELMGDIDNSTMTTTQKKYYNNMLANGLGLDEEGQAMMDTMSADLVQLFGIDVTYENLSKKEDKYKHYEGIDSHGAVWDEDSRMILIDGLNPSQRQEAMFIMRTNLAEMIKNKQYEKARNYYKEESTKFLKEEDDAKVFSKLQRSRRPLFTVN